MSNTEWIILFAAVLISFFLGRVIRARKTGLLTTIFQSVKSTFEGNDGKISSRKTTAFWYVVISTIQAVMMLFVVLIIVTRKDVVLNEFSIKALWVMFYFYVATLVMILLLFGIVTWQQIQSTKFISHIVAAEEKKEDKPENTEG